VADVGSQPLRAVPSRALLLSLVALIHPLSPRRSPPIDPSVAWDSGGGQAAQPCLVVAWLGEAWRTPPNGRQGDTRWRLAVGFSRQSFHPMRWRVKNASQYSMVSSAGVTATGRAWRTLRHRRSTGSNCFLRPNYDQRATDYGLRATGYGRDLGPISACKPRWRRSLESWSSLCAESVVNAGGRKRARGVEATQLRAGPGGDTDRRIRYAPGPAEARFGPSLLVRWGSCFFKFGLSSVIHALPSTSFSFFSSFLDFENASTPRTSPHSRPVIPRRHPSTSAPRIEHLEPGALSRIAKRLESQSTPPTSFLFSLLRTHASQWASKTKT
jgi:hypothetical protein